MLVFDAKTRKLARTLLADAIPGGVLWRLRYLADGTLMGARAAARAVGSCSSGRLAPTRTTIGSRCQGGPPAEMDLHPDGLRVATAHHDGYVRITRLAAGKA